MLKFNSHGPSYFSNYPTTDASAMSSTDFALAQERITARRQQREAEAITRQRRAQEASKPLDRLPFPLSRIGQSSITTWENLRDREGTRPAFRVGQVDAELLDEE